MTNEQAAGARGIFIPTPLVMWLGGFLTLFVSASGGVLWSGLIDIRDLREAAAAREAATESLERTLSERLEHLEREFAVEMAALRRELVEHKAQPWHARAGDELRDIAGDQRVIKAQLEALTTWIHNNAARMQAAPTQRYGPPRSPSSARQD